MQLSPVGPSRDRPDGRCAAKFVSGVAGDRMATFRAREFAPADEGTSMTRGWTFHAR